MSPPFKLKHLVLTLSILCPLPTFQPPTYCVLSPCFLVPSQLSSPSAFWGSLKPRYVSVSSSLLRRDRLPHFLSPSQQGNITSSSIGWKHPRMAVGLPRNMYLMLVAAMIAFGPGRPITLSDMKLYVSHELIAHKALNHDFEP